MVCDFNEKTMNLQATSLTEIVHQRWLTNREEQQHM